MDSLKSVLPFVLRKRGLFEHAEASHMAFSTEKWIEERLPNLKGQIKVSSFKDTVLTLACSHSIASQECQHLTPLLRQYLDKEFQTIVTEIRLIRAK